jgi:hypothetical protein
MFVYLAAGAGSWFRAVDFAILFDLSDRFFLFLFSSGCMCGLLARSGSWLIEMYHPGLLFLQVLPKERR